MSVPLSWSTTGWSGWRDLNAAMAAALRQACTATMRSAGVPSYAAATRTRCPSLRRMRAQREAAMRLPVRAVGPEGVIRTIFMDQAVHDRRPTSGSSAGELVAQLREARHRTERLTEDLSSAELMGPYLTIVNPVLWEIGHIAWFHEYWTLRHAAGRAPLIERCDRLWGSRAVAHTTRWHLDLPA